MASKIIEEIEKIIQKLDLLSQQSRTKVNIVFQDTQALGYSEVIIWLNPVVYEQLQQLEEAEQIEPDE